VRNERFGHPVLLCSSYKSGFSGCVYNDSLYYTYINKENALLLRRLHESALLFRLEVTDTATYRSPKLVSFGSSLFLFYLEEIAHSYRLRLQLPLSGVAPKLPEPLLASFSKPPIFSLQATEYYLYLVLTEGTTVTSYRYSDSDGFEPLYSEEEPLSALRLPWEGEKKQLKEGLMQAICFPSNNKSASWKRNKIPMKSKAWHVLLTNSIRSSAFPTM